MKLISILRKWLLGKKINLPLREGIYSCKYEDGHTETIDTLQFNNSYENYFRIVRQRDVKINFDSGMKTFSEIWRLEYDENKNLLTEVKTGKIITWNNCKGVLVLGDKEYSLK